MVSDAIGGLSKAKETQFIEWLNWGVESGAIGLPAETGSIRWPSVSLEGLFLRDNQRFS